MDSSILFLANARVTICQIWQIPDNEFENGRVQVGFESRFPKLPTFPGYWKAWLPLRLSQP